MQIYVLKGRDFENQRVIEKDIYLVNINTQIL